MATLLALPLLPVLYLQSKIVRAKVPILPEAKGPSGKSNSSTSDELDVLIIGESTIAGVGVDTHEEGFAGAFAKALSDQFNTTVNWKVAAKSGFTAKDVRDKIIPTLDKGKADIILIGLGGNDTFTLTHPKKWQRHIKNLISDLREIYPSSPVVFLNMPPIADFPAFPPLMQKILGAQVDYLSNALSIAIEGFHDVYYSSEKITLNKWLERLNMDAPSTVFFSDGVHPTKLTYETWARETAMFIQANAILNRTTDL